MEQSILENLREGLHPLERKVLAVFEKEPRTLIGEKDLLSKSGLDEARLSMAIGWLSVKNLLRVAEDGAAMLEVALTDVGVRYQSDHLPGLRIIEELTSGGSTTISSLRKIMEPGEVSKHVGALKKAEIIKIIPGGVLELVIDPVYETALVKEWKHIQNNIGAIFEKEDKKITIEASKENPNIELFSKYASGRGKKGIFHLKEKQARKVALTELGKCLLNELPNETDIQEIGALTPDILKDGSWRGKKLRKYNIQLTPSRISSGVKHPYKAYLDQVKQKFVSMGFAEMRGPLVESEFWDMDALYMPQFHPAREIHDVYFVKKPVRDATISKDVIDRVAAAHETGGESGSRGWRYPFDPERTRRLVLRSQGTAVSARTLGAGSQIPGKYFSIARCFRYDQVDATHAPDFFQVEGIVLGDEINFRTLLGLLTLFAKEVARAEEIKFLPAYFPFTEPSVEMHVRHPKLGWMELGGAGLFRPEVTGPLGVDVPVIAWGLGLDRMAMVALGISDIRDLFSPDLGLIRKKQLIDKMNREETHANH